MTFKKTKLAVAMAAVAALGAGASQNAAAYAYAYSYADVFNFGITFAGAAGFGPGGLVNGSASAIQGVTTTSTACGPAAYGSVCDIPVAQRNIAVADDTFSSQEGGPASFARADGLVPDGTRAQDLAEAKSSDTVSWKGTEQYDLTGQVVVAGGGAGDTVTFTFDAIIDVLAKLEGGAILGSQAQSSLNFTINLSDAGTGATVFTWSPDGPAGSPTVGGTEINDPFNMNLTLAQLNADGSTSVTGDSTSGGGPFSAVTLDLADGTYNLSVSKKTSTNANFNKEVVPEPASMALLGLGLAGIGAARRRKARA